MKVWRLPHLTDAVYLKVPVKKGVIRMVIRAFLKTIEEATEKDEAIFLTGLGTLYPHTVKFYSNISKEVVVTQHYKFKETFAFREKRKKKAWRPYAGTRTDAHNDER